MRLVRDGLYILSFFFFLTYLLSLFCLFFFLKRQERVLFSRKGYAVEKISFFVKIFLAMSKIEFFFCKNLAYGLFFVFFSLLIFLYCVYTEFNYYIYSLFIRCFFIIPYLSFSNCFKGDIECTIEKKYPHFKKIFKDLEQDNIVLGRYILLFCYLLFFICYNILTK